MINVVSTSKARSSQVFCANGTILQFERKFQIFFILVSIFVKAKKIINETEPVCEARNF
jgi:hypothetical protein